MAWHSFSQPQRLRQFFSLLPALPLSPSLLLLLLLLLLPPLPLLLPPLPLPLALLLPELEAPGTGAGAAATRRRPAAACCRGAPGGPAVTLVCRGVPAGPAVTLVCRGVPAGPAKALARSRSMSVAATVSGRVSEKIGLTTRTSIGGKSAVAPGLNATCFHWRS